MSDGQQVHAPATKWGTGRNATMLDDFVVAAWRAGQAILDIYDKGFDVELKADATPVTDADRAAEAIILADLSVAVPEIPVVAEESVGEGRVPEIDRCFILVDPLDGTREFVSRNGEFTVNIALIEDGQPVCGVIYAPVTGLLYAGDRDVGAWQADCRDGEFTSYQAISVRKPPVDGLQVVASRSHLTQETRDYIARFPVAETVSAGSSLKFGLVAAGKADLYPRLGRTMEWDTAAGDAVVRAAGGEVCKLDGSPLVYGKTKQTEDSDFANPWFVVGSRDVFSMKR